MSKKRSLALLGASSMLLSILPAAAFAQAPAKTLEHLTLSVDAVKDPVEISALWASKVGKADHVLVTTEAVFADSLASGALQGSLKSPLLFIDGKSATIDAQTVKTITGLGATKVTVLGGLNAVSKETAEALGKVAGVTAVDRIDGESRVETSVKLAEKTGAKEDTVIIARADDYADSLAAGALAANKGYPVVLVPMPYKSMVDGKEVDVNLHPAVEAYLKKAGIKKVIVAGGKEAVAEATFEAVKALVNDTTRAAGDSRRETAVELAKLWASTGKVTVVDGYSDVNGFHNGFAAALSASNLGAPVILSNKAEKLTAGEEALFGPAATGVTGYCGTYVNEAICKAVADKQGAAVKPVKLTESDAILPLKVTPSDMMALVGDATKKPNRQYEVADAKADVKYTIKLVKAKKDDKGNVVLDADNAGLPQMSDIASIAVVNGAAAAGNKVEVNAVSGKITFSVAADKENASGYVMPVVTAMENGKEKVLGMGGALKISPKTLESGTYLSSVESGDWTVESVDKDAKTIIIVRGGNKRTLTYKESDVFYQKGENKPENRVDFATFVKGISKGDIIAGTNAPDHTTDTLFFESASLQSIITWKNAAPAAPTAITAVDRKENSVALELTGVEDGATLVIKYYKLTTVAPADNGQDYSANKQLFTQELKVPNVKNVSNKVKVEVTGLDASSKYDFAVSQVVGEETSDFAEYGAAGADADPANVVATTKKPVKFAVADVERVDDPINNGAGSGKRLKITLADDNFNGGDLAAGKITVVASTGGKLTVAKIGDKLAGASVDETTKKVGAADAGGTNKRVFYVELNHVLDDALNDIEYTVKFEQGAVTSTTPVGSPSAAFDFVFKYR